MSPTGALRGVLALATVSLLCIPTATAQTRVELFGHELDTAGAPVDAPIRYFVMAMAVVEDRQEDAGCFRVGPLGDQTCPDPLAVICDNPLSGTMPGAALCWLYQGVFCVGFSLDGNALGNPVIWDAKHPEVASVVGYGAVIDSGGIIHHGFGYYTVQVFTGKQPIGCN